MNGFLNIGSLVLGLIALGLPVVNLIKYKNDKHKHWNTFSILSMTACAVSIYFQIYVTYILVRMPDWPALDDTIGAVTLVSLILLIVTITLNVTVVFLYHEKADK